MGKERARRSLEETWAFLESEGEEMPRDAEGKPSVAPNMPNYDDDDPRFHFFRTHREGEDYSGLMLPRTYFGRSEFVEVAFRNTDLTQSRMCWNNFTGCDFTGADLSGCDMRASRYVGCNFTRANLRGADFRHSWFEECDFTGADLRGAMAEDEDFQGCVQDWLDEAQQESMSWQPDKGDEPPGG